MLNLNKYDCVFFDLDGTLLEDQMRHYRCYCDIIKQYGGRCISLDEYWNDKRNKVKRTELLQKSKFNGNYNDYIIAWLNNIEKRKYLKYEVLKPDVLESLQYIRSKVNKMVLVTMRRNKKNLKWQLENLCLKNYFDEIIVGDKAEGQSKAELINKEIKKRNLVIGDTEDDMQLAIKLECPFIALTNGARDRQFLYANYYFNELREVIGTKLF